MPKTPEELAAEQAAADKAAADKATADAANGFPSETPLDQMTAEQREAYWKHQARKHQKRAEDRADFDKYKADSEELEKLRTANATDEEKAREEARREGENIGAARYLKEAIKGRFQGLTGKTDDEVETIFAHVDATSFVSTTGDIDVEKLKSYSHTFGTAAGGGQQEQDPVAAALARQRQTPGGGAAGSVAELRRQRVEERTKSKN